MMLDALSASMRLRASLLISGPSGPQALVDGDLVADSLLDVSAGSRLTPVAVFGSSSRLLAVISWL